MTVLELNEVRKRKGISFEELANLANLPKSTVEKVLFGVTKHPRIDTMQAIERALGVTQEEPTPTLTDEEKELFHLISQLTDEEVEELSKFVDFIISKRKV